MGLLKIDDIGQLKYFDIMNIYRESIIDAALKTYPNRDRNEALLLAEQDFYAYLDQVYFSRKASYMAVWEEKGRWVCALRAEPFKDGYLITGIETAMNCRRKGYAKKLLSALICMQIGPIYSHVFQDNKASLQLHLTVGFSIFSLNAEFSDGSVHKDAYTLIYR